VPLYIVGTPLGNLGDLSPRAREVLSSCDFIAAEDTRVTGKLLAHFGIHTPLIPYHRHNRAQSEPGLWARLEEGQEGALVADAGMPVISDPGRELVAGCRERGIPVRLVPGPDALTGALALSGLPAGRFCFEGFLSTARKSRYEHLQQLKEEPRTLIFYEAPHKLLRTLEDMENCWGDRRASVSREMTKLYEETLYGTLSSLREHFAQTPPKGEFVLVVEGALCPEPMAPDQALALARAYQKEGLSPAQAAREAAGASGRSKREIYRQLTIDS